MNKIYFSSKKRDGLSWHNFWEKNTGNKRLFRGVAEDYFANFRMAFPFNSKTCILDFGCGQGYLAGLLAERVKEVYIYDASSSMLKKAQYHNKNKSNIIALEKLSVNQIPPLDYILANSVIQYMTPSILKDNLMLWRSLLKCDGKIIISDILPDTVRFLSEMGGLLLFSHSKGFLLGQFGQLASLFFSDFTRVARKCPLTYYPQDLLSDLAAETKLSIEIMDKNLVYGKNRYTACFCKKEE